MLSPEAHMHKHVTYFQYTELMNIAIYGGNGFVGSHIAEQLNQAQHNVSCVSRSGSIPNHLSEQVWAQDVSWIQGDAAQANKGLLAQQDAIISTIGAPPLPTFSQSAFDKSLKTNGEVNAALINAAADAGVKNLLLLGAKIPSLLDKSWFAYAKGKGIALEAAKQFAQLSEQHFACVMQPGAIYGTRHTRKGSAIPLTPIMHPLAKIIPSQFISVEKVAECAARAIENQEGHVGFKIIEQQDI